MVKIAILDPQTKTKAIRQDVSLVWIEVAG